MSSSTTKSKQLAEALRRQIVSGDFGPGGRLPTRIELQKRFNVSYITVQHAMDRLRRQGFVESRGRSGTVVTAHPPHRCRYALFFRREIRHQRRPFWEALSRVAERITESCDEHEITVYYGIGETDETYEALCEEVRTHQVAGLILGVAPHFLTGTPLLEDESMPRVNLGMPQGDIPSVDVDGNDWLDNALAYLKDVGCRSPAAILHTTGATGNEKWLDEGLAKHGFHIPDKWRMMFPWQCLQGIRNASHLLVSGPRELRPDSLVVCDDHLLDPVVGGVEDAGLKVGRDITIVSYANFPAPPIPRDAVVRLGFDCGRLLELCVDTIDHLRAGEEVPQRRKIAAEFESDYTAKKVS